MNSKYLKINILFALFSALTFLGCSGRKSVVEEKPQQYELLQVKACDYVVNTEYAATVKGLQDIRVIPRIEGYLQGIYVKEGEQVKAGQLLFRVDAAPYRAEVEAASANVQQMTAALEKSQLEYNARKNLYNKKVISDHELALSKSDLDMAKANLAAAQATLSTARNNLAYTELRSPSDGVIGRIPYRKGDYVGPNIEYGLTQVADNSQMRVYFSITEAKIMEYLSNYKSLAAAVEAMPDVQLRFSNGQLYGKSGRVESISGIVDETTGAVSVCAIFDNRDGILLSGGTGKIVMPAERKNAIVIPQEATYEIQDKVYVMKVVDGKAVSTIVQVEPQNNGKEYVVVKGLKEGDVIVAKGAGFVQEGERVNG